MNITASDLREWARNAKTLIDAEGYTLAADAIEELQNQINAKIEECTSLARSYYEYKHDYFKLKKEVASTWVKSSDELPPFGVKVLVYDTSVSDSGYPESESMTDSAKKWSRENPYKIAYTYKTALDGHRWMISFAYDGVPHIKKDVKYWMRIPEVNYEH